MACSNGLLLKIGAKRLLYRTHRRLEDDLLQAALVLAMARLPDRWSEAATLFERAQSSEVVSTDDAIELALDAPEVPRKLVAEVQCAALAAGDRTRYGVVQAITEIAYTKNADPNVRFAMERAAGRYLAAARAALARLQLEGGRFSGSRWRHFEGAAQHVRAPCIADPVSRAAICLRVHAVFRPPDRARHAPTALARTAVRIHRPGDVARLILDREDASGIDSSTSTSGAVLWTMSRVTSTRPWLAPPGGAGERVTDRALAMVA